mmetsp:Transcript_26119/g.80367  ORF Transcript_26119/g.80367 Transcript_26119/m.80367 type:complete len:119 (-) Transcript_26119:1457-1813(-)
MQLSKLALSIGLINHSASIKLQVDSPRQGAVLDLFAVRANGGINLDISIVLESQAEYTKEVDGKNICLYVNGSAAVAAGMNIVPVSLAPGFLIPSTMWQVGRTWLHIGLFPAATACSR